MIVRFDRRSADSYRTFLQIRDLPSYSYRGHGAVISEEYAARLGLTEQRRECQVKYSPHPDVFDYQRDIARMAIRKQKFAIFADCGLGKTLMLLEFARHAVCDTNRRVLIVSPLMVRQQTADEHARFYRGEEIDVLRSAELQDWLSGAGARIGIVNYEAITDRIHADSLGGLILDESSMLKNHYGAWGQRLIEMGRGVPYKLCATGTPAPNDRIEFANHAVFLDRAKTVNEFLATYFINRGQTENRWELMQHAVKPFYRSLSAWSIFLSNPAVYGWKDNVGAIPPIRIHVDHIDLTDEQRKASQNVTGRLFASDIGGIGMRGKLSRIAKGSNGVSSRKPLYIAEQVAAFAPESVLVWCHYNDEQAELARLIPEAENISGATSQDARLAAVRRFQSGESRVLITKPKILGFGLNLQICTKQIFSGLKDSYEEFYQAVKRSNRIGSTRPLDVHIPVTELEVPFVNNVLRKAKMIESDTALQEALFKENCHDAY